MSEDKEEIEGLVKEAERYARENGFRLNPDEKVVKGLVRGLLHNESVYGERYCPCRRVTGDKEEDKKIICPCVYHKSEIEEQGYCHCRLFVK
ncbi:MAG: ferredoxin:thioredoxin reductase [Candidatus Altiarchaeales archaeon ex4484_2]|nr:MAG: ferredoxin:thioredoxin reductase [Candidatus Altiarchaeales archaeon ex4484_2]